MNSKSLGLRAEELRNALVRASFVRASLQYDEMARFECMVEDAMRKAILADRRHQKLKGRR